MVGVGAMIIDFTRWTTYRRLLYRAVLYLHLTRRFPYRSSPCLVSVLEYRTRVQYSYCAVLCCIAVYSTVLEYWQTTIRGSKVYDYRYELVQEYRYRCGIYFPSSLFPSSLPSQRCLWIGVFLDSSFSSLSLAALLACRLSARPGRQGWGL
ncbi:hypothetical protein HOY80DRAFT_976502 [Tuber brumale]|nr:hypothetical protein HOY80DRAFT_976502 [Tuber brumale]